jgi:hypothetical protein
VLMLPMVYQVSTGRRRLLQADVGLGVASTHYIIALEHGYSSWQKLKEHLHAMSSSKNC